MHIVLPLVLLGLETGLVPLSLEVGLVPALGLVAIRFPLKVPEVVAMIVPLVVSMVARCLRMAPTKFSNSGDGALGLLPDLLHIRPVLRNVAVGLHHRRRGNRVDLGRRRNRPILIEMGRLFPPIHRGAVSASTM